MELREAKPVDGRSIAEVHVDSWRAVYRGVLPDDTLEGLDVEVLTKSWTTEIEHPDTTDDRYWVITSDERIVGYARTGPNRDADVEEGVFEVYGFYTHPQTWGNGAGSLMMAGVLEDFRSRGATEATLWVVDENPRARRFYEKEGWVHEPGPRNTCFGAPEVRYRIEL